MYQHRSNHKPNKTFVSITRLGVIAGDFCSTNQCGEVGVKEYTYRVVVKCAPHLDPMGFLIRHEDIGAAVERIANEPMGSCEQLVLRILDAVCGACDQYGTDWTFVKASAKPVGDRFVAYMHAERSA